MVQASLALRMSNVSLIAISIIAFFAKRQLANLTDSKLARHAKTTVKMWSEISAE